MEKEISGIYKDLTQYTEAIVDTLQEPLLVLGGDLKVLFANKAFYRKFKVSKEETENKEIYSLGNGQWDIPELKKLLNEIIPSKGLVENYEITHEFPSIGARTMLLNARKLSKDDLGENNRPDAVLLAIDDVTERKIAEHKLLLSEVRFQKLFETAKDGVLLIDPVTEKIIDANPYILELTRYSKDEILGKELWEIGAVNDIRYAKMMFAELQTKGYVRYEDLPIKSKDGEIHEVEFVSNRYSIGETDMIQCNIRDITDRKAIEKKAVTYLADLEKERERVIAINAKDEAILAGIGDGLVAVDKDGKIILVNSAFSKILGWNESEVKGRELSEIVRVTDESGKEIPKSERPLVKVLKEGIITTTTTTTFYERKDGTSFPAVLTIAPIVVGSELFGAVEVFRDITKEKELDRVKSEFISIASHQLRTPLTAIKGYSGMLLEGAGGELGGKQREYIEEIKHGNDRMLELISALLDVSRIELGVFQAEPELVNFEDTARSVLKDLAISIENKKLKVKLVFEENLPLVNADPQHVRMIFQNLLSNAVKYTPPDGSVILSIKKQDRNILVVVEDTGFGIPKDDQARIFMKMFRADNVREKDPDGTGLGLYIVKSIVEKSGGNIRFESEENKGTAFYVAIPLGEQREVKK